MSSNNKSRCTVFIPHEYRRLLHIPLHNGMSSSLVVLIQRYRHILEIETEKITKMLNKGEIEFIIEACLNVLKEKFQPMVPANVVKIMKSIPEEEYAVRKIDKAELVLKLDSFTAAELYAIINVAEEALSPS